MGGLQFFPEPGPDEAEVRAAARAFAETHLRPTAREDDVHCRFRREIFDESARRGLTSLLVPIGYGGGEKSARCFYGCLEEISKASPSMTVTMAVTNLIQGALVQFGTAAQKAEYLPRLVSGQWLGAFSLSEPNAGSDAASLRLDARKTTGGYRLNGNKVWCSSAGHADFYLVMGRTSPDGAKGITSFLIPKDTPGFRVGKQEKKLGLRSSSLAELVFEDCFLPENFRLAKEGEGLVVALSQLDAGRITIGTTGVGIATEALERAWRFLSAREARGEEKFEDGTRQAMAEHYAHIQAVRGLVGLAADLKDQGLPITTIASQAKLLGSELAVRVTHDAIHFMGFAGGLEDNEVERLLRDAKALPIVEGTNQIQRLVLARQIKEMMEA